jgi:hypothetical protein
MMKYLDCDTSSLDEEVGILFVFFRLKTFS